MREITSRLGLLYPDNALLRFTPDYTGQRVQAIV
jgi:hypothetical protein